MTDKFERYHATQGWFSKNNEIHSGSRQRALEIVCQKVCEVMNVERVGIWFYVPDRSGIYEEMTYVLNGNHSSGTILLKKDLPVYFHSIDRERVVASDDTFKDDEVAEFKDSYSVPFNVHALLDAPIFSDGQMIGIVCCETTQGPRSWDIHDKNFAAIVADFMARIIETEKRHTYEKELKHRIGYLEIDLRKKLDDLREAKLSLDMALDAAQVGKWDWYITTNKLSLNKTWYTRLGYEYNELPQNLDTFKRVLHPEDVERVFHELDLHLQGKSAIFESRYRMISKTGEVQYAIDRGVIISRDSEGRPTRMTGVNVNITPVIKLEQTLFLSQQQLTAMIQSLPTPVAMFDQKFHYIAYSAKWKEEWEQFGVIRIGNGINNNYSEFQKVWLDKMNEALMGKMISKDEDLVQITSDTQFWIRWIIQPWKHANGEIGGVVVMAENITHRKEAEMRITQSSKLSALGEMAGGIAHEINNPLSIIKGYIDLLKRHFSRQTLTPELMLQYIDKMDNTVSRISKIVNGMRRFSRESSMDEKSITSLNKIIEETLDICLERINNNGTALKFIPFESPAKVLCRPVEVSQVILNLINNAFQAISTFPHPWIEIRCEEMPDFYRIKVIDCGEGIPSFIRQKLFQPFFTTKDIGVGTGLGLSISRGIIQEHDGKLYYQDEAPNTTFVIELPKVASEV